MKVTTRNEKDAFDRITHNLCYLEKERFNLLVNMFALTNVLSTKANSFPEAWNYVNSLNTYTKEWIDENNKEVRVYEKMLRYLQLMLTNDTYEYYTDSYYYDYFAKTIDALEANKYNRKINTSVFYYSISLGVAYHAPEVTIASNVERELITDDIFEEMLKRIPKR